MELISKVLKELELVVRGKSNLADERKLQATCTSLFHWSCEVSGELSNGFGSDESKTKIVNAAVALHNKVRMVSSATESSLATKSLVRASVAWLLSKFGDQNPKVLCLVVRLHGRAAQELLQLDSFAPSAILSVQTALTAWEQLNTMDMDKILSIPEREEVLLAVFNAYLLLAKNLGREVGTESISEQSIKCYGGKGEVYSTMTATIQDALAKALDVAHNLPNALNFKIKLVVEVLQIGCHAASNPITIEKSVKYFEFGLNLCDNCCKPQDGVIVTSISDEVDKARFNYYVSLAHAYQELKQFDKALEYIAKIESGKALMNVVTGGQWEAIALSKCYILCNSLDLENAQECLDKLLRTATNHAAALNMIRVLIDSCSAADALFKNKRGSPADEALVTLTSASAGDSSFSTCFVVGPGQHSHRFGLLAERFRSGPEFLVTQLAHLKYLMGCDSSFAADAEQREGVQFSERKSSNSFDITTTMWKICLEIVQNDELDSPMSAPHRKSFLALLNNRIDSLCACGNFNEVQKWIAMALQVNSNGPDSKGDQSAKAHDLLLLQSEAFIHVNKPANALLSAQSAVHLHLNCEALVWVFVSCLFAESVDRAMDQLNSLINCGIENNSFSPREAMRAILACSSRSTRLLNKIQGEGSAGFLTVMPQHCCAKLGQWSKCLSRNDNIAAALYQEWLLLYCKHSVWRSHDSPTSTSEREVSYLHILCRNTALFLGGFAQFSGLVGKEDSITSGNILGTLSCSGDAASLSQSNKRDFNVSKQDTSGYSLNEDLKRRKLDGGDSCIGAPPSCPTSVLKEVLLLPTSHFLSVHAAILAETNEICEQDGNLARNSHSMLEEAAETDCGAYKRSYKALEKLGNLEDLVWLVKVSAFVGKVLMNQFMNSSSVTEATSSGDATKGKNLLARKVVVAELFENLQLLMALLWDCQLYLTKLSGGITEATTDNECGSPLQQAKVLCYAASLRTDCSESSPILPNTDGIGNSSDWVEQAGKNIRTAAALIAFTENSSPGSTNGALVSGLKKAVLIIELQICCRIRSPSGSSCAASGVDVVSSVASGIYGDGGETPASVIDYILSKEAKMMEVFSASDFLSLSENCLRQRNTTMEVVRTLLQLSLKACARGECPNKSAQGCESTGVKALEVGGMKCATEINRHVLWCYIYCRLIDLAPSRLQALNQIEEFVLLVTSMDISNADLSEEQTVEENRNMLVRACATHIETVSMTAYNYGLTLMELGRYDLSEKFISKSIQLLHITSSVSPLGADATMTEESMKSEWHRSIQDADTVVLNAMQESHNSSSCTATSILKALSPGIVDSASESIAPDAKECALNAASLIS